MGKLREGNKVAKWERREGSEVARSGVPGFVQRWGMQGDSKIPSYGF